MLSASLNKTFPSFLSPTSHIIFTGLGTVGTLFKWRIFSVCPVHPMHHHSDVECTWHPLVMNVPRHQVCPCVHPSVKASLVDGWMCSSADTGLVLHLCAAGRVKLGEWSYRGNASH